MVSLGLSSSVAGVRTGVVGGRSSLNVARAASRARPLRVAAAKGSTPPDVPKPRPGENRKTKAEWFQAILSK